MGYIGKIPATQGKDAGPSLKLDDVSSNFDGLTTVFDLTVNGTEVDPHINNIQIYLSGVHQLPGTSYSLSGSQVVFTGAPSSSLNFHGSIIGDARLFIPDNDTVETSAFTTDTVTAISGAFQYGGSTLISGSSTSLGSFGSIFSATHITASGNISASGIVIADTFQSTGGSVDGISFTDDLNLTGNFTASGEISASGNLSSTGNLDIDGTSNLQGNVTIQSDLGVVDVNASGNITGSSVSASVGEFTTATIDKIGGAIDFNNENMTNVDIDSGVITGITDITVADGGTGVSTLTDGGVLLGSGTSGITAMSVLADSEMIVGDGSTDPVAESGATLRTSIGVGTTDDVQFTNITGSEMSASVGKFTTIDIDGGVITGITDLVVADGGTGAGTFIDGGVLLGSGTSAITAMSVLADSEMIVGDGSTDPVAESGATLRTSIGVGTTDDVKFANITGSNDISASGNLSITGNVDVDGTSNFTGDVTLQNDLVVTGKLTAEEIHTTFISSSIAQATGSTIFGDATSDSHHFTGSIDVSGSFTLRDGDMVVSDTLTATNIGAFTSTGAIDFDSQNMTNVDIDSGVITGITDLVVADGGTGVSTLTDGGVLLGNGAGAIQAMAVLTDGQMIVGDGTTDPVPESGATLRTSVGVGLTDDVVFSAVSGSTATFADYVGNISGSSTSTGSFGSVVAVGKVFIDQNANNPAIDIDSEATSDNGISVDASVLTTGKAAYFYSDAARTLNYPLVEIQDDNATADKGYGLKIRVDGNGDLIRGMAQGNNIYFNVSNHGSVSGSSVSTGSFGQIFLGDVEGNSSGYDLKIRSGLCKVGIHTSSGTGKPTLEFGNAGGQYASIVSTGEVPLHISTNSSGPGNNIRMTVSSSGVGIGTTNPDRLLHVQKDGEQMFKVENTNVGTTQYCYVELKSNAAIGHGSGIAFTGPAGMTSTSGSGVWGLDDSLQFTTDSSSPGNNTRMTITDGGNVGIGDTNPGQLLSVTTNIDDEYVTAFLNAHSGGYGALIRGGDIALNVQDHSGTSRFRVGGNGDVVMPIMYSNNVGGDTHRDFKIRSDGLLGVDTSSERYKKKITDISDTSWVYDLRPVDFEWKTTDKKDWGLIAEEVIKVKPELVGIENDLPEWINYDKLIPVLLKEIQEQNKRLEALENA